MLYIHLPNYFFRRLTQKYAFRQATGYLSNTFYNLWINIIVFLILSIDYWLTVLIMKSTSTKTLQKYSVNKCRYFSVPKTYRFRMKIYGFWMILEQKHLYTNKITQYFEGTLSFKNKIDFWKSYSCSRYDNNVF